MNQLRNDEKNGHEEKNIKKLSEYLYEFNRLMRKISDLIHVICKEWISFVGKVQKN